MTAAAAGRAFLVSVSSVLGASVRDKVAVMASSDHLVDRHPA